MAGAAVSPGDWMPATLMKPRRVGGADDEILAVCRRPQPGKLGDHVARR